MNAPLVSVIIPTYNRNDTVVRAVKSVIAQDYRPLEIIVVDDGSTDDTKECIKSLLCESQELRVRYLYQKNSGVSIARNYGLCQAQGKYLSTLDSDDVLLPGKISVQVRAMVESGADICYGRAIVYDTYNNIKFDGPFSPSNEDTILKLVLWKMPYGNAYLFTRDLIEKNHLSYRGGCSWGEDNEFLIKAMFLAKKIICVDMNVTQVYIGRSDGLSSFRWQAIEDDVYIYQKICDWLIENGCDKTRLNCYKQAICCFSLPASIVNRCYVKRKSKEAKMYFSRYPQLVNFFNLLTLCNGVQSIKLLIRYLMLKLYFFKN